jgi:hypothetical protein
MNTIRKWINLVENIDSDREFYINQANEFRKERDKWWPVSDELMASYKDGSHAKRYLDGSLRWLQNHKLHRDGDKPARISGPGGLEWRKNGELHRDGDKPAEIFVGGLYWWKNGLKHRDDDKPAIIYADGELEWCKNDKRHRVLGPAHIDAHNKFEWWFRGEQIPVNSQDEYEEWLKKNHPFEPEVRQLYQLR